MLMMISYIFKQIVRIYDVYIKENGTLQSYYTILQKNIQDVYKKNEYMANFLALPLVYLILLQRLLPNISKYPEKSLMVSAFKSDVPVYYPALSDSSIGLNMLPLMNSGQMKRYR